MESADFVNVDSKTDDGLLTLNHGMFGEFGEQITDISSDDLKTARSTLIIRKL